MIKVEFTLAQANMVRQALRAEEERMKKSGYNGLAIVMSTALDALSNAVIDSNLPVG
jgi:hypothetical protein